MVNQKLIILLAALILLGLIVLLIKNGTGQKPTHPANFFDQSTFYQGIEWAKKSEPFPYKVTGGIIPHHLLPSFIIADFFKRLTTQDIKTVILIGPNHYEKGNFKVLTSFFGWQSPFGVVEPNLMVINDLLVKNLVKIDEQVLPEDHAVAGIMPFVKYYLPGVKVVPILLKGFMIEEEVKILASNLKNYTDEETIFIAAVDFSHYLTSPKAQMKDKITLEVMKNFDYKKLLTFNNDYLDSPPAIVTLLMVMQDLGKTNMDLLHHTNSGIMQKNDYVETTSYFSIAYY